MPRALSNPNPGVLFITPEIYPLNKTGGLADVSAAL
ncbi:MAG: glycogen/starch synthase, partial [Nitrosospira sp.]